MSTLAQTRSRHVDERDIPRRSAEEIDRGVTDRVVACTQRNHPDACGLCYAAGGERCGVGCRSLPERGRAGAITAVAIAGIEPTVGDQDGQPRRLGAARKDLPRVVERAL